MFRKLSLLLAVSGVFFLVNGADAQKACPSGQSYSPSCGDCVAPGVVCSPVILGPTAPQEINTDNPLIHIDQAGDGSLIRLTKGDDQKEKFVINNNGQAIFGDLSSTPTGVNVGLGQNLLYGLLDSTAQGNALMFQKATAVPFNPQELFVLSNAGHAAFGGYSPDLNNAVTTPTLYTATATVGSICLGADQPPCRTTWPTGGEAGGTQGQLQFNDGGAGALGGTSGLSWNTGKQRLTMGFDPSSYPSGVPSDAKMYIYNNSADVFNPGAPSTAPALVLDGGNVARGVNYYGIEFRTQGIPRASIIQEATGNLYVRSTKNLILNDSSTGYVGIGSSELANGEKLQVGGKVKITDGTQGVNRVLTSDANGLASWVAPAIGDITAVVAGAGLSGGALDGSATLTLDLGWVNTWTAPQTISTDVVNLPALTLDGGTDATNQNYHGIAFKTQGTKQGNIMQDKDGVLWYDANAGMNFRTGSDGNKVVRMQIKDTGLCLSGVCYTSWPTGGGGAADNLGNHTATANIKLGSFYLSGDGGDEGVFVGATGKVGIGTNSPGYPLDIAGGMRIQRSGFEPYILFSKDGVDIGQIRAETYGISFTDASVNNKYVSINTTAGSTGEGSVLIKNLSGIDNRMVIADSSGKLATQAIPADNLGNHTATANIKLGSFYLSGDGGDEGIQVDSSGQVGIGGSSSSAKLFVMGNFAATDNAIQGFSAAGSAIFGSSFAGNGVYGFSTTGYDFYGAGGKSFFAGNVRVGGDLTVDGEMLNLNADQITSGTLDDARLGVSNTLVTGNPGDWVTAACSGANKRVVGGGVECGCSDTSSPVSTVVASIPLENNAWRGMCSVVSIAGCENTARVWAICVGK